MIELQPPGQINFPSIRDFPVVFLAGSIEMGVATDWQKEVIRQMKTQYGYLLNPCRKRWDSSWTQSIHNEKFREQVEWELNGLQKCNILFFYFDPETKSPISLMELGYAIGMRQENIIVVCPDKFYRKGNIDIICSTYPRAIVYETLQEGIDALKELC